jgi:uncharacterized membrane protein
MTCYSFFKRHFGTDLLIASWLFLISSFIFVIGDMLLLAEADDTFYIVLYAIVLVACVVFTYGSFVFLELSYPEKLDDMIERMILMDLDKLTFWEEYFIGNDFLVMAWLFFFAYMILFVFPIWAMANGSLSVEYGFIFIGCLLVFLPVFCLFIVACFPHNLIDNNGTGSSMVFDNTIGRCCKLDWLHTHFGSDLLLAVWGFFLIATLSCAAGKCSVI